MAGFENIFRLDLPTRPVIPSRDEPVTMDIWNEMRNSEGKILDSHRLKCLIFRGGIEKSMRLTLWKYILNYYKWQNTDAENEEVLNYIHCV